MDADQEYEVDARVLEPGEERRPALVMDDGKCWCGAGEEHLYVHGQCSPSRAPADLDETIASTRETEEETSDRTDDLPEEEPKRERTFGGMTASEASKLRWERVRARQAQGLDEAGDEHRDDVRWVRVPVRTGAIIKRLADDAKKGNSQAARELRAWLAEVAQDEENELAQLDRKTRARLLDKLLADIAEEDEAAQGEAAQDGTATSETIATMQEAEEAPARAE